MKTRIITAILFATLLLEACSAPNNTEAPEKIAEVRTGVYMSNDPADFPLPTSGYTVYFVGETHGNQQTKMLFQAYLQKLYKEAGLRDIILEEDQAYESDANDYVQGRTAELIAALCLRADILGKIREFNTALAADEKVAVHLVDVDSPLLAAYKHLAELHTRLGAAGEAVEFPTQAEFTAWYTDAMYELIDDLRAVAQDRPDVLNGLATVSSSLEWYFLGNRLEISQPRGAREKFGPLREDVITQNVRHVLSRSNGRPVMAFFGASHGMKTLADPRPPKKGFKSWAERLGDEGIRVYSLTINGLSGKGYWHLESFSYEVPGQQQYEGTAGYRLEDGSSLASFFKAYPDTDILYADLRAKENGTMHLPQGYLDIPAGQVYDGVVIFEEFTPMEDACPQQK